MGGYLIFIVGGVIGFCLGIISFTLMITVGESEMELEKVEMQKQSTIIDR